MRNMSFAMTIEQIQNKTKTVTRRNGWKHAKPGVPIQGVKKAMGLQKGEKIEKLAVIVPHSIHWEEIKLIDYIDCIKEGFPEMSPEEFVDMYCKANSCTKNDVCTVIEFYYLENLEDHVIQLCDSYMYQGNITFDDFDDFEYFMVHLLEGIKKMPTVNFIKKQYEQWKVINNNIHGHFLNLLLEELKA